jgi:hypothetical protein
VTETTGGVPGAEPRCPWCSSVVTAAADRCPSCGATLRDTSDEGQDEIPGVTQVDPVVGLRRPLRGPNRLVGWLANVDTEPTPTSDLILNAPPPGAASALEGADAASIAPPSDEVRREMQRLELAALKAELEDRAAAARMAALDAGEVPLAQAAPEPAPPDPAASAAASPEQTTDAEGASGA